MLDWEFTRVRGVGFLQLRRNHPRMGGEEGVASGASYDTDYSHAVILDHIGHVKRSGVESLLESVGHWQYLDRRGTTYSCNRTTPVPS
jgi:hypothetical protein